MALTETKQTIPEIWDTVVSNLGGKKIKFFDMACSQHNNFTAIAHFQKDASKDAILLKNSRSIIFCTYKLRNRSILFECSLDDIGLMFYYDNEDDLHIILLHALDDGLYWRLSIKI